MQTINKKNENIKSLKNSGFVLSKGESRVWGKCMKVVKGTNLQLKVLVI